ncbi:MAG: exodeoxyribonuclease VII small subunit [Bacteroidales bacterium]|jgi:exodeoxyribonuclease VII small subunit|nr:exodeoxyribonuclease VII small subunit [Bacteroidales bacterium]
MNNQETNYAKAFAELQEIVQQMENADIPIDELAEKIKHASQLIAVCKAKLVQTEAEVNKIMDTIE